jgi:transcriptional regulator with XRE-family HTH domain
MTKTKTPPELTLGEKVNIMFYFGQQQGMAIDYRSVANATGVSVNNLHKIRSGENDNPGIQTLMKLAVHFKVQLGYFDNKTREQCWAYLERLVKQTASDSPKARKPVVLRVDDLSAEGRAVIASMHKYIRHKEGLNEEE